MAGKEIVIDGTRLTIPDVAAVAHENSNVTVAPEAVERMNRSRKVIESILESNLTVYGVNTGFGKLSEIRILPNQLNELQLNLVRSHAAGVGEAFPVPVTRAIMLLRANTLARGNSGVRPKVVQLLLDMLNKQVHPVIPSRGSVGASGDLAPLAHLALVLIGEGVAMSGSMILPGRQALSDKGLNPVVLQAKEGLALINGTQAMTGMGALAWLDALRLAKLAEVAGAASLDVTRGTDTAFDPRIAEVRPHPGAGIVARNLRDLISGSGIRESHRGSPHKVQDHYSLRCMPQVHGAVRDVLAMAKQSIEIELNSSTDNPLVFVETGDLISGGNFHGAPMSLCLDFLGIALCQIASISERRVALLIDSTQSELPPFLTRDSGLNSGFMIAQVTAASLVSENKVLAHPASADTIPTSANKEDHVSMGVTAALKLQQIAQNTAYVLAIELLCAAQALDLLAPQKTSPPLQAAYELIRGYVPMMEKDRILSEDIASVLRLSSQASFLARIESALGHPL
ncbi:MAG TPA: histidine ammonia-lyase [Acidobacteriota bacterium]|nr:histidine ammonia-lyase [Acidobacteriota bacterium]